MVEAKTKQPQRKPRTVGIDGNKLKDVLVALHTAEHGEFVFAITNDEKAAVAVVSDLELASLPVSAGITYKKGTPAAHAAAIASDAAGLEMLRHEEVAALKNDSGEPTVAIAAYSRPAVANALRTESQFKHYYGYGGVKLFKPVGQSIEIQEIRYATVGDILSGKGVGEKDAVNGKKRSWIASLFRGR